MTSLKSNGFKNFQIIRLILGPHKSLINGVCLADIIVRLLTTTLNILAFPINSEIALVKFARIKILN